MWRLGLIASVMLVMAGCGQRGPLYVPDKNARVVTHPAPASAPGDSSAPSSAPR
jgi:predicted small lipoprotein YifL